MTSTDVLPQRSKSGPGVCDSGDQCEEEIKKKRSGVLYDGEANKKS